MKTDSKTLWDRIVLGIFAVICFYGLYLSFPYIRGYFQNDEPLYYGDFDCSDFDSQVAAQAMLEYQDSDIYGLDADSDGIACESLD